MAENHAVTDWSDGSVFWFYVDTLDKVFINLCLAVDNDPETGMVQGYFNSEFAGAKYYMEQDGGFIELSTTADNWNHIVIDAGYSGWIGVDLQEGLQCKTTELADQTVDGNLGHVYGVGFYLELGDMYVRDFRVAGIAEGVEVPDGPDTSDTSDTSDASDTSDIPNTSDPSDPRFQQRGFFLSRNRCGFLGRCRRSAGRFGLADGRIPGVCAQKGHA